MNSYEPKFNYDEAQFNLNRATNIDLYKKMNHAARKGVNGLIVGSVVGAVGFWIIGKPVFWGAVIGGISGGLIQVTVFPVTDEGEKKESDK